ncbi:MAG: zf-HC2 domain-containing protein [Terriglobales bacterium]
MPGETKHGMECSQFEARLSEALDGQLSGSRNEKASFEAHARVCPICGPLLADAVAGQRWLKSLEEVEPPAHLIHNILAATSGISSARLHSATPERRTTGLGERARQWWDSFITPTATFVRQPRFVMSFGMIFFSFSLALSALGVKPADVAKIDLRPAALKRNYYTTQGRVVKFYENIRFVYEIESRVREFKRSTTPAEPGPAKPTQNRKNNNDTSGQPDQKQERNYSREENQPVLAGLPDAGAPITPLLRDGVEEMPPAVTVTTNRRFV